MPSGRLRINAPAPAVDLVIAPMVAPFLKLFPQIELEIVAQTSLIDIVEVFHPWNAPPMDIDPPWPCLGQQAILLITRHDRGPSTLRWRDDCDAKSGLNVTSSA